MHPWFSCIDWPKIASKALAPPYKPQLDSLVDVKHFGQEFTKIQPSEKDLEHDKAKNETLFTNFSYEKTGEVLDQTMQS